jgi:hypothetical protein
VHAGGEARGEHRGGERLHVQITFEYEAACWRARR